MLSYLGSILKSRDISLSTRVRLVKVMVFPVVMYGCESWTVGRYERMGVWTFAEKQPQSHRHGDRHRHPDPT